MMEFLKIANLGLSFFLELAMLAAFGYWGFVVPEGTIVKWLLGLGVPAVVIVIWGWRLAPKAKQRLKQPWLLIAKVIIFGLATVALYWAGQATLAVVLGVTAAVNLGLGQVWKQG